MTRDVMPKKKNSVAVIGLLRLLLEIQKLNFEWVWLY